MARGRKPIDIDPQELQSAIFDVESRLKPTNRTQLWKMVSETEWAEKHVPPILAQTAMIKAEKFELVMSTPKGNRGRTKGSGPVKGAGTRKERKYKDSAIPEIKEQFGQLGKKAVDAVLAGKVRAAVKCFCWDCMGGSKKQVSLCESYTCPLWPHRPWQHTSKPKKKVKATPKPKADMPETTKHELPMVS